MAFTFTPKQQAGSLIEDIKITKQKLAIQPLYPAMRAQLEVTLDNEFDQLVELSTYGDDEFPQTLDAARALEAQTIQELANWSVENDRTQELVLNQIVISGLIELGYWDEGRSDSESVPFEKHEAELTAAEHDAALALVAEQQDRDRQAEAQERTEALNEQERKLDELEALVLAGDDWFDQTPDHLLLPLRSRVIAGLDATVTWLDHDANARMTRQTVAEPAEWDQRNRWKYAYLAYLEATDAHGHPVPTEAGEDTSGDEFPFATEPDEGQDIPWAEMGAQPESEIPVTRVLVVGSFAWSTPTMVWSVLQEFAEQHNTERLQIVTGGCPRGAELAAAQWAQSQGGFVETVRDEDIPQMTNIAGALVFIEDESLGAERVLGIIELARLWHRVIRSSVNTTQTPWADR